MNHEPTYVVPDHQHRYLDPVETQKHYAIWLMKEYLEGRNHRPEIIEQLKEAYAQSQRSV